MNLKSKKELVNRTLKNDLSKSVSSTVAVPIISSIKSTSHSRISNDSLVATNLNLNNKLIEQSQELIALSCAYEDKKKQIIELEKKYKDNCIVTNEITLSNKYNKETIDSILLQLETSNKQLEECNNQKKRLQNNYDTKCKENKSYIERIEELQNENSKLINKIESSNRISGSLTRNVNYKENLKNIKNELDICRNELRKYKDGYEESKEKILIMEGALEYKSNEIGVAGHADLLTTISQIRGENGALKADINEKRNKLREFEENNKVLLSQQETLMRQITSTHERLTKSQIDLSKLQSSDIGSKLQETIKERNLLLEYIQNDLEKNGNVCKKLSLLEIDYHRVNEELKLLKESEKKSDLLLEKEISKVSSLTVELTNLRSRLIEVAKFNDLVQSEQTTLSSQLNRKGLEADELSKMQMALLLQMKNKDETLEKTQEDNYTLRSKLTQSDTTISVLQSDNSSMRTRLATLESDVSAAKLTINHLEPLINRLEPELNQLKSEKVETKIELTKLNAEVLQLRPIHQLLADLNKDISDSTKVLNIPSTISSPSSIDSNHNYNEPSLSQQHAVWTGLPSLRHLSPQLYDRVRRIAQDLHRKEIECKEYEMKCSSLNKELANVEKNNGEEVTRLLTGAETSNRAVDEIKSKLNQSEEELNRYRIARTTLDQLRIVLQSFPGGISALLGSTAFTMDGSKSYDHSSIKFNLKSDEEMIKFPDQYLPDLIGRALMYNSNAVLSLQEITHELNKTQEDYETLKTEYNSYVSENESLKSSIQDIQRHLSQRESNFAEVEEILRTDLDGAAELSEKQNLLMITLETKLGGVKRENQLKNAQIQSLQQREESIRHRLFSILYDNCKRCGIEIYSIPQESTRLTDLVQYTNDILSRLCHPSSSISKTHSPIDNHSKSSSSTPSNINNKEFQNHDNEQFRNEHIYYNDHIENNNLLSPQSESNSRSRSAPPSYRNVSFTPTYKRENIGTNSSNFSNTSKLSVSNLSNHSASKTNDSSSKKLHNKVKNAQQHLASLREK